MKLTYLEVLILRKNSFLSIDSLKILTNGLKSYFQCHINGVSLHVCVYKSLVDGIDVFLMALTIFQKCSTVFHFEFNYLEVEVRLIVKQKKLLCVSEGPNQPKKEFYVKLVSLDAGSCIRRFSTDKVRTASYPYSYKITISGKEQAFNQSGMLKKEVLFGLALNCNRIQVIL